MKLLITGGAGYIGTNLISYLLQDDYFTEIRVYDNLSRKNFDVVKLIAKSNGKLKVIKGDLLDRRSLAQAARDVDVVVHLAAIARSTFNDDSPHVFEQTNHWGTAELVNIIEDMPDTRLIYASSGSVYGSGKAPFDESCQVSPETSYANSKFRGEKHIHRLIDKHRAVILRLGNVYGVGLAQRYDTVVNKFLLRTLLQEPLLVHANGKQLRPFISLNDCIKAISHVAKSADICQHEPIINVVGFNASITDIVASFIGVFPDTEILHVNEHENFRSLVLTPNNLMSELFAVNDPSKLASDLKKMLQQLSS